jgi:ketosteroid isomerase-like protein
VEIVRRCVEALARGEFEAFVAAHDPDVVWTTAADEPEQLIYRGCEGLQQFVADISEAWAGRFDDVMEFEAFIDLGDWVVVPWTARVRGRGSGVPIDLSETYAIRVEDGRIVRVDEYRTREEAIEAVRTRR